MRIVTDTEVSHSASMETIQHGVRGGMGSPAEESGQRVVAQVTMWGRGLGNLFTETLMSATVRPIVILAAAVVFTASSGAAQTDPTQVSSNTRSLSGTPEQDVHPVDNPQPPDDWGHRLSFPIDVGGDVWRFFTTGETYRILGLGLAGSLAVRPFDEDIRSGLFTPPSPKHEAISPQRGSSPGELLGSTAIQFGVAFTMYGIGSVVGKPGVASLGRDLARAQLLTGGFTHLVKLTVRRARPNGYNQNSFPSGHTSATFASATVLNRRYGWKVGVPAFGVASYVAASRVADGKHFLSDVFFGVAIGLVGGRTVTFDRGETRVQVSPMPVAGGAGIQVSVFRMSACETAD